MVLNHDGLFSVGSFNEKKAISKRSYKILCCDLEIYGFPIFLLGRHVFLSKIYPVLTNVERGLRSNFWDHSQLFQTIGIGAIEENGPTFWVKCCILRPMYYIITLVSKKASNIQ